MVKDYELWGGRDAGRWVSRQSLRPHALPRTLLAPLLTRELVALWLGALAAVIIGQPWLMAPGALLSAAWLWLVLRGRTLGIVLVAGDVPVAGVRLRICSRQAVLVGLYVVPERRGEGWASAAFSEALLYIARELPAGIASAFAPTHPASRYLVRRYLPGRVPVRSAQFRRAIEALRSLNPGAAADAP